MRSVVVVLVLVILSVSVRLLYLKFSSQRENFNSTNTVTPSPIVNTIPEPTSNPPPPVTQMPGAMVDGFPPFPIYPNAKLEKSSQRSEFINTGSDLFAEWKTDGSVVEIMQWYTQKLTEEGWTVTPSNDPLAQGEQVTSIKKANYSGIIAVEEETAGEVEIQVDFKISK